MPNDPELDQILDRIIDAALPGYSAKEPRPGLEHRILSRTLTGPRRRIAFGWAWGAAIPALACLLLFLTLRKDRATSPSGTKPTHATTSTQLPTVRNLATRSAPAQVAQDAARPRHMQAQLPSARGMVTIANESLPKQPTFPSSSPLTTEEQRLVAYNRAFLQAMTDRSNELEIDPLAIADLRIDPLDIPALDTPAAGSSEAGRNDQQP